jgi:hypothetical protein
MLSSEGVSRVNVATTASRRFPVEDIRRMIDAGAIREDEKFELIEGEFVILAAKRISHERIKSASIIAVVGVEATLRLTNTIMLEPDIAVSVFRRYLFSRMDMTNCQLL